MGGPLSCAPHESSPHCLFLRYSAALQRLLFSMMTVNPQERPSINEILHQLEGLQPAPAGQDTTQI